MTIHNLCTTCDKDFGSVSAFDAHRVGTHAYTYSEGVKMDPIREDGRRCLTTEEMESGAYGYRHSFSLNSRGIWSLTRDLERGRARRPGSEAPSGAGT